MGKLKFNDAFTGACVIYSLYRSHVSVQNYGSPTGLKDEDLK